MSENIISSGAEAIIIKSNNSIIKKRVPKTYRISEIDNKLRKSRTRREAKVIDRLKNIIDVPNLINVDNKEMTVEMSYIDGEKIRDVIDKDNYKKLCNIIGSQVAKMHLQGIIHGDLTTSNFILSGKKVFFIDFGLSFFSKKEEDMAVDLHLLKHALESKHSEIYDKAFKQIIESYSKEYSNFKLVLNRLEKVESRGRNKMK